MLGCQRRRARRGRSGPSTSPSSRSAIQATPPTNGSMTRRFTRSGRGGSIERIGSSATEAATAAFGTRRKSPSIFGLPARDRRSTLGHQPVTDHRLDVDRRAHEQRAQLLERSRPRRRHHRRMIATKRDRPSLHHETRDLRPVQLRRPAHGARRIAHGRARSARARPRAKFSTRYSHDRAAPAIASPPSRSRDRPCRCPRSATAPGSPSGSSRSPP